MIRYDPLTPSVTTALLDGALVSNQFEFPEKPSTPVISSRTHDQFSFNVARKPFTTGCRVRINDTEGFGITRDIYFANQDAATEEDASIIVDKLNAGHVYEVVISYITDVGESVPSDQLSKFNLPATSAPQGLTIALATTSSLHISWLPPAVTAPGVNVENIFYRVSVGGAQMDPNIHSKYASSGEIGQTTSLEYIVEGLLDGTEYTVTVLPYYDLGWDGVEGGNTTCLNVFQCDIMKKSKKRKRMHRQCFFQP